MVRSRQVHPRSSERAFVLFALMRARPACLTSAGCSQIMLLLPRTCYATMLRILTYLPTIFWLLAPAGFCICKLPTRPLAAASLTARADSPAPLSEEDDDEHPSWCTAHKMPVACQAGPLAPPVPDGLLMVLPTDSLLSRPADTAVLHHTTP